MCILVLSQLPEGIYAQRVLNAGAHGFLMKSVSLITLVLDGIRKVVAGEVAVSPTVANQLLAQYTSRNKGAERNGIDQLSDRELHVLTLIGQGHTTASVASSMGISKKQWIPLRNALRQSLLCRIARNLLKSQCSI